jgi:hypothetical protein
MLFVIPDSLPEGEAPHPRVSHQVLILKGVKVVSFDTLLQVLILKGLKLHQNCAKYASSPFSFTSVHSKVF